MPARQRRDPASADPPAPRVAPARTPRAKTASAKTASAKTASAKTASAKTASAKTASAKTASAKTASAKTASAKTASAKTASAKTASAKTASAKTASAKTASAKTASAKTASAKTASAKTASAKTASAKTASAKTASAKTASAKTASAKTASAKTASAKTASAKTASAKTASAKTASAKTASAKTASAKTASAKTASAKTASAKTASDAAELTPRERRRAARVQVGRDQILDAAEELFGNKGYQATSLEQVAASSEFSVGALYMFFDSKQALLSAILQRRGVAQMAVMTACLDAPGTGADQLLTLVSAITQFFRAHIAYGRLSTRMWTANMETLPELRGFAEGFDEAMRIFEVILDRGQADGSLRQGDSWGLARLVSALISSYHVMDPELYDTTNALPVEELLDIVRAALSPNGAAGTNRPQKSRGSR